MHCFLSRPGFFTSHPVKRRFFASVALFFGWRSLLRENLSTAQALKDINEKEGSTQFKAKERVER
jgi:hypothetical protein